jgi:hypothetical protein
MLFVFNFLTGGRFDLSGRMYDADETSRMVLNGRVQGFLNTCQMKKNAEYDS